MILIAWRQSPIILFVCSFFKKLFFGKAEKTECSESQSLKDSTNMSDAIIDALEPLPHKTLTQLVSPVQTLEKFYHDYAFSCAQTVLEQQYLFSALSQEACNTADAEMELIPLLQQLLHHYKWHNNESIVCLSQLSRLDLHSIVSLNNITTYLDSKCITKTPEAANEFVEQMNEEEHMIILHPHIATLLLLQPSILKKIAHKIKQTILFPSYVNSNQTFIEWSKTFGDSEHDANHYWRWAFSTAESHKIALVNNTANVQNITLHFKIWTPNNPTKKLKLYFLNSYWEYDVFDTANIEVRFLLPPGRHYLSLVYTGEKNHFEMDFRKLHFAIVDLTMYLKDEEKVIDKQKIYQNRFNYFTPLNDTVIRQVLHQSNFFEVSLIKQSLYSFQPQMLSVTRFHMVNQYYFFQGNKIDILDDDTMVWYFAKRCPTLD